MKKMLLTAAIAFTSLLASAQFMVSAEIVDVENFETDNLTEQLDMSFGYMINDAFMLGGTMPADDDADFRVFARYYWNESIYLTANTSTEDFSENLKFGAGYSFSAFGNFYVEPNYTLDLEEDASGERNGNFKLGLSYRF
tara:strand:+ start:200 stop:619 length:420 start_codon:yes stop_codon:yes gene_type:complete